MNDKNLRDELDNLPFLRKMKEQPENGGLQVPKHYFKHLPDEVLHKAKEQAPVPQVQIGLLERLGQYVAGLLQPRYALAFASVLALVVASVYFFGGSDDEMLPPTAAVSLTEISDEELFAYVSENVGDFDHNLMIEATGSDLPEVKSSLKSKPILPKTSVPKPKLEEMEEYLDEVIDEIEVEDLEELL